MTAYVIFDPSMGSEERKIKEFVDRLAKHQVDVDLIEFDSREGIDLRQQYDVMSHPAVVLARMGGEIVQKWQDELPLVSEVSYLAHS